MVKTHFLPFPCLHLHIRFEGVIYVSLRVGKEGLTFEKLGEELGIDPGTYVSMSTIENGNGPEGHANTHADAKDEAAAGVLA